MVNDNHSQLSRNEKNFHENNFQKIIDNFLRWW